MSQRVLVLDTSVLCCLLSVPGKETAGPLDDRWDQQRISDLLEAEEKRGSIFVLPLATIIETGNHVAQTNGDRFKLATDFGQLISKSASATSPWAAFADQSILWGPQRLLVLADTWPPLAAGQTSLGDATIKDVAEWYAEAGVEVQIVTGDAGLKSYEPLSPPPQPRRRRDV